MMIRRERLRIALPKCAELPAITAQFRACGFPLEERSSAGLQLIKDPIDCGFDFEVFRLAPADVGTYVEHGISHVGIMGTDLLRESEAEVWRPLTFRYGKYPLVFAAPRGESISSLYARPQIRIATPYPRYVRALFAHRGISAEIVSVADSATACLLGLADAYIDRLLAPQPLSDQGFHVVEVLGYTRLKLVVNRACWSRRRIAIQKLIQLLEEQHPEAPPEIEIPFDDDDDDLRFYRSWDGESEAEDHGNGAASAAPRRDRLR